MLYANHFSKQEIVAIFRFLDWVLLLPEGLENKLTTIIHTELEKAMPYLSRMERDAIERGMEKGMEKGVKEGKRAGLLEAARKLFPILSSEQISEVTGLSLQEVELLRKETKNSSKKNRLKII